ncbi:hypothetical protein [Pseudomonas sp. SDO55104_S430]
MDDLSVLGALFSAQPAGTGKPQTTRVVAGKSGIVLNVEPIAIAFKANVLRPLKSLITPID